MYFLELSWLPIAAAGNSMKRMAKPEEVGKLAAFLLSDEASFITGGCYTVDGGYTAQ